MYAAQVPQPLPESQMGSSARTHPDILRLLRQLLQQCPVWPAAALHEAVAAAGGTARSGSGGRYPVDDLLPKLCYKFRNGAWRRPLGGMPCFIRQRRSEFLGCCVLTSAGAWVWHAAPPLIAVHARNQLPRSAGF